jgi:hypothetical protein
MVKKNSNKHILVLGRLERTLQQRRMVLVAVTLFCVHAVAFDYRRLHDVLQVLPEGRGEW